MCKLILATSQLLGYGYLVEVANPWYNGNGYEQYLVRNRMIGPYAWCFWTMIACNVLVPQLFWSRWFRTTPGAMFVVAILVNVGMWLERFVIIVVSLHRDYLPSSWRMFYPTWVDVLQLLGGFGLFATPFLLFIRFVPMVALSEVKAMLPQADPHHSGPAGPEPESGGEPGLAESPPLRGENGGPIFGVLARFRGPAELLATTERLRAAGYRRFDTNSPFPVHDIDRVLGLGRSKVPLFTLAGGLFGLAFAQWIQWFQSAVAYRLVVGGKPLNSVEAFVPITFETTILYAAFGAVGGMLFLNGLPRLYHPVFQGRSFARATGDGFFVSVEARDPKFDPSETPALLAAAGGTEIELLDA
jgi:hypothetical protein